MASRISRLMTSSHIYVTLLVAVKVAVCACPQHCSCYDVTSGWRVDCRGRTLSDATVSDVPFLVPAEAEELDVGRNTISTVDWISTLSAPELRRLYADRCEIQRISAGAFSNLATLEYLDLSFNHISQLSADTFVGLPQLRTLRLDNNKLSALTLNVFHGLTLSILRLDNNVIRDVDELAFRSAAVETLNVDENRLARITSAGVRPLQTSLRNLTVSHNAVPLQIDHDAFLGFSFAAFRARSSGLRSLKFVEDVAAVESLDVGDNDLEELTLGWSAALALGCRDVRLDRVGLQRFDEALATSLRSTWSLDLSGNQLSHVESGAFRPLADLRQLDLSRNRLSRLPSDFSRHMSAVEHLNLSANSIGNVDSAALSGLRRLKQVDLSRNSIQVLPDGVETVLASVEQFDVSGNPFHCNCELAWLRRWLAAPALASRHPDDARLVRCGSPGTPGPLLARQPSTFDCSPPVIVSSTASRNVEDGSDVVLSCTAAGDPTPRVKWASPFGDVVSVSPSEDRLQSRLSAIWQIRRARSHHTGWYRCESSNMAGNGSAYTYLHVFSPTADLPADLSDLAYPMIPLPLASTTTSMTVASTRPRTTDSRPETETSSTTITRRPVTSRTSTSVHVTKAEMTSHDVEWISSLRTEDDTTNTVVLITVCTGGAFLLVLTILLLVCLVVRRVRRSGKYDPSRPHETEDGWRRPCPWCGSRDEATVSDPALEASSARLKFNTSTDSGTWTPADQSYVSDRPLITCNGVTTTTCPDPVQQALIGPPLTNDVQSR